MNYKNKLLIKLLLYSPIIPLIYFVYGLTKCKQLIYEDLARLKEVKKRLIWSNRGLMFIEALLMDKTFRNLFYLRSGNVSYLLRIFLHQIPNIELSPNIMGGAIINHGFSIVMNPRVQIGKNLIIHQNVTIGDVKGGVPILGDNVSIGAGAIIIGAIHIGNNVKIGAGAIVVCDVPDNCTVVGNKAVIIKRSDVIQ